MIMPGILRIGVCALFIAGSASAQLVRLANGQPVGEFESVDASGVTAKTARGSVKIPWSNLSPGTRYRHQHEFRDQFSDVLAGKPLPDLNTSKVRSKTDPAKPGATSPTVAGPAETAPVAQAAAPRPASLRTRYLPSDMPSVRYRNPNGFYPCAWRFGTKVNDIAFFMFDSRQKEDKAPDTLYFHIPGHPQYNEPQAFRGRVENDIGFFRRIAFSAPQGDLVREFVLDVQRGPGEDGFMTIEAAITGVRGSARSTVLHGLKRMGMGRADHGKNPLMRIIGFTEEPELSVRAYDDGTRVACTLTKGRSASLGDWYLLPQQGADPEITLEVFDDKGTLVEALKLKSSSSDYMANDAWAGRLRKLEKDKTYAVRARINLGALYGELKAETITMLRDLKL
ncbi:MAG: hypothetical protein U1E27_10930 [Kiritimatiellia bacterium]|nr:hypothetical protein [Kiritimatiellia bacterium]